MRTRFLVLSLFVAFNWPICDSMSAAPAASPRPTASPAAAAPAAKVTKGVVDQTAQTIIFCYYRLVDKIRYLGTEITPAAFEAQMKELKDRGITVISMQDLLAWKCWVKNITPSCGVISFVEVSKS